MKNLPITLFLCVLFLYGFSQSGTITLNFNGTEQSSGNALELQQVQIINLTQGVDTTLNNGNFSFQLNYSLGIEDPGVIMNDNDIITIHPAFPNPFNESTEIVIDLKKSSHLDISLYSVSGVKLKEFSGAFVRGTHRFNVFSSYSGLLFLLVSDGQTKESLKLINQSTSLNHSSDIIYQGVTELKENFKSEYISNPFKYYLGDKLQMIGSSNNYANSTIYDSPKNDKTFTFLFTDPFYRIIGHRLTTSRPSFVDILFSVEDLNYKGVDNLSNANFIVYEDNESISPTETFRYIKKMNSVPYKLKTVVLLDNSASVGDKIEDIKDAAIALVNTITERQEFAIYCFSDEAILLQDFTSDLALLTNAINTLSPGYATTNLYGAFIEGVQRWEDLYTVDSIQQGFQIVFTDGDDTQGSSTLSEAISARGSKKTYMIGLGNEINPEALNQLSNPAPYYSITDISQLEEVFYQIQEDIFRYSNSFYWLNYMSPKRGGQHNLKLEITPNINTGSDSYYSGVFNAIDFVSVYSGVYVNTTFSNLYGIESLEIFNTNTFELKAVTYWASEPPEYLWSSSNTDIVTVEEDPFNFNRAYMNFPGIECGSAIINVRDETNSYEKEIEVTLLTPPIVTSLPITNITQSTATSGGNIICDGGAPVITRGVCWSTTTNPTIANSHTTDGSGAGTFTSYLTGLTLNAHYYVRAYAINSEGTAYGNQQSFVTPSIPIIITNAVTDKTQTTATSGGNITSDGGAPITLRGVCWSSTTNPTIASSHTTDGSGAGTFTSYLTGLTPNTPFYVRAYATNSVGTAYGNQQSFTTSETIPTVITNALTDITQTTATSGGNVTSEGGATVTLRGICWNTIPNPTIADNHTNNGSGLGQFTSSLTGLTPNTPYYVRAYATNSVGTAYGNQESFVTLSQLPTVTTITVTGITQTTATSGGNVTFAGGASVTVKGVCWSTSPNPTIADNHTNNGSGLGQFTSSMTELTPNTPYYVRAYATNSFGTSYGNQESFTTLPPWFCGDSFTITHVAGNVAPVTKTTTYGTVTNISGETSKCWIKSNLGSDHQATAKDDATEASGGWYWQFNRMQGYKHDGSYTITPAWTIWNINENSDWLAVNDPCTLLLGSGWRIPTSSEWTNVDASGNWTNPDGPWNSALKIHGAGFVADQPDGFLVGRGSVGLYASRTQNDNTSCQCLYFGDNESGYYYCEITNLVKAYGHSIRCLRD